MSDDASRSPALLYMHIPKTAGTSFRWIVERQYSSGQLHFAYPGFAADIERVVTAARTGSVSAVIGHFQFGLHALLPNGGRYVTLLRDPVDQVISQFNYLIARHDADNANLLPPGATIAEFAQHPWAFNAQTRFVTGWDIDQIAADPTGAVERAITNIDEHFVAVGTAELFDETLHLMARRLGWRVPRNIPHMNPAPESPLRVRRRDLTESVIDAIKFHNVCDRRLHAHVTQVVRQQQRYRRWPAVSGWWAAAGRLTKLARPRAA